MKTTWRWAWFVGVCWGLSVGVCLAFGGCSTTDQQKDQAVLEGRAVAHHYLHFGDPSWDARCQAMLDDSATLVSPTPSPSPTPKGE